MSKGVLIETKWIIRNSNLNIKTKELIEERINKFYTVFGHEMLEKFNYIYFLLRDNYDFIKLQEAYLKEVDARYQEIILDILELFLPQAEEFKAYCFKYECSSDVKYPDANLEDIASEIIMFLNNNFEHFEISKYLLKCYRVAEIHKALKIIEFYSPKGQAFVSYFEKNKESNEKVSIAMHPEAISLKDYTEEQFNKYKH